LGQEQTGPGHRRRDSLCAFLALLFAVCLTALDVSAATRSEALRAQGSTLVEIVRTRVVEGASATEIATELHGVIDSEPTGFVSEPRQAIALLLVQGGIDPGAVGVAVRDGFSATRSDVAQMLRRAGVGASDVSRALRDGFASDALSTAQELASLATKRLEIAMALREVFGASATDVIAWLRTLGAGPVDVSRTLRVIFGLGAESTHDLLVAPGMGFDAATIVSLLRPALIGSEKPASFLKYSGFYYRDILAGLTANGVADKTAFGYVGAEFVAEKTAEDGPVVYFHSDESYLPSSAEWFLDRAVLWSSPNPDDKGRRDCGECQSTVTTLDELQDEVARWKALGHVVFWLDRTPDRYGALGTAKAYTHVLRLEQVTDIQYWIFYPYNGPGTVQCRLGEVWEQEEETPPMGEHIGDWESVTLRYRNDTYEIESAFMSSHGDYHRYAPDELQFENGHVVVTPSLNGHANYSPTVDGSQHERKVHYDLLIAHLDIDLLNKIDKLGARWLAWQDAELMAVNGETLYGKKWWEYEGRWGPHFDGELTELSLETVQNLALDCVVPMWVVAAPLISLILPAGPLVVAGGTGAIIAGLVSEGDDWANSLVELDANGPQAPPQKDSGSSRIYVYEECPDERVPSNEEWEQIGICLETFDDVSSPLWALYCTYAIRDLIEDLTAMDACEQLLPAEVASNE